MLLCCRFLAEIGIKLMLISGCFLVGGSYVLLGCVSAVTIHYSAILCLLLCAVCLDVIFL